MSLLSKTACRQPRVDFCVKRLPPTTHGLPIGRRLRTPGRKKLVIGKRPKDIKLDPLRSKSFTEPEVYWKANYYAYKSSNSRMVFMTPDEFLNLCVDFDTSGVNRSTGKSKYDREVRRVALVRENMKRLSPDKQKIMKDVSGVMQLYVQELNGTDFGRDFTWLKNAYEKKTGVEYSIKPPGERLLVVDMHYGRHRALDFKLQGASTIGVKVTVLKGSNLIPKSLPQIPGSPPDRITVGDCLLREPSSIERRQKQYNPNYLLKIKPKHLKPDSHPPSST